MEQWERQSRSIGCNSEEINILVNTTGSTRQKSQQRSTRSTKKKPEQKKLHQHQSEQLYSLQHGSGSTGWQSEKRDFSQYPSTSTRRKSDQRQALEDQSGSTTKKSEHKKTPEHLSKQRESLIYPSAPGRVKVSGPFRSLSEHSDNMEHQSASSSRKLEQQQFHQHPSRSSLGKHPRKSSQSRREENIPSSYKTSTEGSMEEMYDSMGKAEEISTQKKKIKFWKNWLKRK